VVGTATDPYQPAEGRFRLTRGAIEAFAEAGNPFGMITRGPLIVRDIDVLAQASARAQVGITVSIPTIDPDVWRRTEPGTAPPRQRLAAIRRLIDAGIDTSVGMAPVLPGISDAPEQLAAVVRAARDAGATAIWTNVLYLKPGTREHFLENLARDWPELLPMYEDLYAGRAYVAKEVVEPVRRQVRELAAAHGIADRRVRRPIQAGAGPDDGPQQLPLTTILTPPGAGPAPA
jgi:DNA repair photolyase